MSRSKRSSKLLYVLVLLFIIMVLVKSYFALKFVNPSIIPDEATYSNMAKNIGIGKFTSGVPYAAMPPPGYSIFLSVANVSSNADLVYHLMLIINCILSSSIIFPAFFILKKFIDEEEALYFSLAASCLPSVAVYFPLLMSENLFLPLFLFSAWFLLESVSRKSLLLDFLSGFSVFMLVLTRAIGVAMIPGLLLALFYKFKLTKDREYSAILKSGCIMLLSFILPFLAWYYYKINVVAPQLSLQEFSGSSNYTIDLSGYSLPFYINGIKSAFSSVQSLLAFLSLSIHEVDYLLLVTYFAFLIFAAYSVYKRDSLAKKHEYSVFASYTIVSFLVLTFITTIHMYSALMSGLSYYTIFGRYIDPFVVPFFIMGVIGFYQFQKEKERKPMHAATDSYLLAGTYILLLAIFTYTMPMPQNIHFMTANLISTLYLAAFNIPPLLLVAASLPLFLFMFLMQKNDTLTKILVLSIIFVSLLVTSFSILMFYPAPNETESRYSVARYLQKHASQDTLTLFDSENLDLNQTFVFYSISFWSKSRLMLYPLNDSRVCPTVKADYLVSNKTLAYPYGNVTSDGAYNLYIVNCS
ncbi:glycosyltransferase family 39 protein [Candidatus Micrarchaeota archaeon]|nr:glycosyltransferase family 39 protein [Candidatus Micrarchaeota archaeon]